MTPLLELTIVCPSWALAELCNLSLNLVAGACFRIDTEYLVW